MGSGLGKAPHVAKVLKVLIPPSVFLILKNGRVDQTRMRQQEERTTQYVLVSVGPGAIVTFHEEVQQVFASQRGVIEESA